MLPLDVKPLFEVKIDVDGPMYFVGALPQGHTRRVVTVTGGAFVGERLRGVVLSGGADSVMERNDGGLHLDVRITLKTDSDEYIYMTYFGRRNGPPEIMDKIVRREFVAPGDDYFRIAVQFETGAPRLLWLNNIIAVGTGTREANGPNYSIYEVL